MEFVFGLVKAQDAGIINKNYQPFGLRLFSMWLHMENNLNPHGEQSQPKSLIIGIVQAKGMQMPICKHAAIGGNTQEGVEK